MAGTSLPRAPESYDRVWMDQFTRAVELALQTAARRPAGAYAVTGLTELVRQIDAGSADLATVRQVLATLINDLQKAGRLS